MYSNYGDVAFSGTAYGFQYPCPPGTYSIQMGNRYKEDCLICPEGSFCQMGTSKPSPCPPYVSWISDWRYYSKEKIKASTTFNSVNYFHISSQLFIPPPERRSKAGRLLSLPCWLFLSPLSHYLPQSLWSWQLLCKTPLNTILFDSATKITGWKHH